MFSISSIYIVTVTVWQSYHETHGLCCLFKSVVMATLCGEESGGEIAQIITNESILYSLDKIDLTFYDFS